jgi:protein-S-isoprenylcysteine O-methyltransferase Ste14
VAVLELRIPPPVVALVVGAAMWALSRVAPPLADRGPLSTSLAVAVALAGLSASVAGTLAFRRARTTVNPMKPEKASFLVTRGIYRITRNPMYVGLLLLLVGWAVYLVNAWSVLGPLVFVAYITRFQIRAEERALLALFGEQYATYTTKVRRWL